jgi:hypothetical protein
MATRNIVKGTEVLSVTNLTANDLVVGETLINAGTAKDVPAVNVVGIRERAADLGDLIAAGSVTATLAGVTLTETVARSLEAPSVSVGSMDTLESPQLPVFADATRPAPTAVAAGYAIFNTDDLTINISNGTAWYDPAGLVT